MANGPPTVQVLGRPAAAGARWTPAAVAPAGAFLRFPQLGGPACTGGAHDLTSLGLLKAIDHPFFPLLEWRYHLFIRKCLVEYWPPLQCGADEVALGMRKLIFLVLEIDRKAKLDFMLLAQSGENGRALANELLWNLLSNTALNGDYRNLSNLVSSDVKWYRRLLDRPPDNHRDRERWGWNLLWVVQKPDWGPRAPPPVETVRIRTLPGGIPLAPPACWGTISDGEPSQEDYAEGWEQYFFRVPKRASGSS